MAKACVVVGRQIIYNDEGYDSPDGYDELSGVYLSQELAEAERVKQSVDFVRQSSGGAKRGSDIGYFMEALGGNPEREYLDYFESYGALKKKLPDAIVQEIAESYDFFEVVEVDFHG